jgi:3-methyladenine DNA glycosylase AlkC
MPKKATPKTAKNPSLHPSQRFTAPISIEGGTSLAALMGQELIELLAESMSFVHPEFDRKRFAKRAARDIVDLGIMQRGAAIAHAMAAELPTEFEAASAIVLAALGPELTLTEGNGLKVFFYLPHSQFISHYGVKSFGSGMLACYELTKRFTAEYCIRPLLQTFEPQALKLLRTWAHDPSPHVRRLVSEGTRPRLPWAMRLPSFQSDPRPTLKLLDLLKDDDVQYVRRSVANHLGDILKDNPNEAYEVCERWVEEASTKAFDTEKRKARFWIVRHAVRLPAKQGVGKAKALRRSAQI